MPNKQIAIQQSPLRGALRLRDAADYLSVSVPTLHRLLKRGMIKPNRSLRTHLFPIDELDRFLRDGQSM